MKVSIEILYHCRCDHCQAWWSVADRKPKGLVACPDCHRKSRIEGFQNGNGEDVDGVGWVKPDIEDEEISFDPDDYSLI